MISEEKVKGKSWWKRLLGWRKGFNEVIIVGLVYGCYGLASGSIAHKEAPALQHAVNIINWEKVLGLFHELGFQSFFLKNKVLLHAADTLYTILYYPALILFFFWAYNRHQKQSAEFERSASA